MTSTPHKNIGINTGSKLGTAKLVASNFLKSKITRRHDNKIIITGPGRSGTTFLVLLLTRLGQDTGFEPYNEDYNSTIRAGTEHRLFTSSKSQKKTFASAPRILKHPEYSFRLGKYLQAGLIGVDHVIIPLRDLHQAATSRVKAGLYWHIKGLNDNDKSIAGQEKAITWALGKITSTVNKYNIPHTFINFPQMVTDSSYCYQKLQPIFNFNQTKFNQVFKKTARPKIILHK